jgi:hypothetical protein
MGKPAQQGSNVYSVRKWFPVPSNYELADSWEITTTIERGENTSDIELK